MLNERNAFQQLMYYWAGLHPYNAITIVKVAGPADVNRLRRAMGKIHESLGISRLRSYDHTYELDVGSSEVVVEEMEATDRGDLEALAARATFELNRPFEASPSLPVRLFVLVREGYHYIGRTYQHWIGDAYSMNSLFCRVLAEYLDVEPPAGLGATDRHCPPFRRVFLTSAGPYRWCAHVARLAGELVRFGRCHRPAHGDESDVMAQARFPSLSDDTLPRLSAAARRLGVTVNDLMLAALAEAVAVATPERLLDGRRRNLALTSIVDLRPLRPERLQAAMGLYLSYFNVICPWDEAHFERLLTTIHAQTMAAKARRVYLQALIELQLAVTLWPRIPLARRVAFFSRRKPVGGAVTNIRVPEVWLSGALGEAVSGWWRVASTGPLVPLVLTVTTAGGRLTCGIATRASGFRSDAVESIERVFCDRLAAL